MLTIKSYTNIEQSKKLAEILPLESADMTYRPIMDIDSMSNSGFLNIPDCYPFNEFKDCDVKPLPCWSLATLLEEIPEIINFDGSDYTLEILKEGGLHYLSYSNPLEHNKIKIEPQANFIDACYELILKLNKLKLL